MPEPDDLADVNLMVVSAETHRDDGVLWAHTYGMAYSRDPDGTYAVWEDDDLPVEVDVPDSIREAMDSWAAVWAASFDDRAGIPYRGAPGLTKYLAEMDDCSRALAASVGVGPDHIDYQLDGAQAAVARQIIERLTALVPEEGPTA